MILAMALRGMLTGLISMMRESLNVILHRSDKLIITQSEEAKDFQVTTRVQVKDWKGLELISLVERI